MAKSPANHQLVLDLAESLWDQRDTVTLDEVDGAFYWAACREELVTAWIELSDRTPVILQGQARLETFWNTVHSIEHASSDAPEWLDLGRGGLRSPMSAVQKTSTQAQVTNFRRGTRAVKADGWVIVGVRDSRWVGEQVEHTIRQLGDTHLSELESGGSHADEATALINLRFLGPSDIVYRSTVGPNGQFISIHGPVILCAVAYPLPPEGLIAQEYNAVAFNSERWHPMLPEYSSGQAQLVPVAIRTWLLGLLVGMVGMRFVPAMRMATSLLGTVVSQRGFNGDRMRLVERVPEAGPHVFSRGHSDAPD